MKTTVDNNQRIFIHCHGAAQIVCNLKDVEGIVRGMEQGERQYLKIYHLWNAKPKVVSKTYLKQMLDANQWPADFIELI